MPRAGREAVAIAVGPVNRTKQVWDYPVISTLRSGLGVMGGETEKEEWGGTICIYCIIPFFTILDDD